MQKHKKTWLIIIGIVLVVGLILGWAAWRGSKQNKPQYTTVQAEAGPLRQTVSVVGTVKPLKELALNFLTSGRVSNVAVRVGDSVKSGQLLGELDYSALLLRKNEAEAGLQIAQANLNKLLSGASQQTIAVSQASVEQAVANQKMAQAELDKLNKTVAENIKQAEKTLNDLTDPSPETATVQEQAVATAQTNLTNIDKTTQENLANAYNSGLIVFSDKILAAKVALDHINTILTDDDAKYVLSVKDSVYLQRTKDTRILALESYTAASQAVTAARDGSSDSAFTTASDKTKQFLNQTAQALSYAYSMLEATITSNNFSQAKLDNYKSIISGQINQINAAITAAESA
ncbi:MAG TPA: biotin/lipoyl-binding protein, partial [bacterium]|nr:biotin/lipoyl-binding protein [bacterium]HPL83676.1 biotin/lipoyl-binding protein [bacterium]